MQQRVRQVFTRWRVAIDTVVIVAVIIALRLVVDTFSLDFITLSPLFTSVVAGGLFVMGIIVAGTLADYKESERMPAEITAALANIQEDCIWMKASKEAFDLARLRTALGDVVTTFRQDLADASSRNCLVAVDHLSQSFLELERLDVPANYIVRLRQEQGTIRKTMLRVYQIQRTEFLPSAYILLQTVVGLIIAALEFTKLDPLYESIAILIVISYFFVYLLKLLKIIDTPFRVDEHTKDDVSLFLLNEFAERVAAADHEDVGTTAASWSPEPAETRKASPPQ